MDTILIADGDAALRAAADLRPRLVLLDLVLPGRDREEDVVKALGLGAEDYMIKPFSTQELLARIRTILTRGR